MAPPYDPYGTYGPQLPTGDTGGGFSMIPLPLQGSPNIPSQGSAPQMADPMKLIQALNQRAAQIQQQAQPIMGQYIPRQIQQGPTPPWASPNTKAGQKANLGAALGQAIGGAVTQYAERKEMQKAQNIAMDMQRLSDAITNPTPENKAMAEEILNDDKRRNEIAKVMNIQFMGDDKRKPYQKLANQIFHKRQADQQKQQDLQQQQQRLQQNLAQGQTPYFNQLQRKMPQMPGISPETQLQLQLIQAGYLPKAGEQLTAFTRLATNEVNWQRAVMAMDASKARTLMMGAVEEMRLQGIAISDDTRRAIAAAHDATSTYNAGLRLRGDLARAGATLGAAQIGATSREKVAGIAAGSREKVAETQAKSREKVQKEKNEQAQLKLSLDTQMKGYQQQLNAKTKELQDANKSVDKLQGQVPSKAQQDALNNAKTRQHQLEGEVNALTNSVQSLTNFSKYMEKQEGQPTTGPQYGPGSTPMPTPPPSVPTLPPEDDEEFQDMYNNANHDF